MTDAKYMVRANRAKEALWLRVLVGDLKETTLVYGDSQSVIQLIKNKKYHERAKHIDIKNIVLHNTVVVQKITATLCRGMWTAQKLNLN